MFTLFLACAVCEAQVTSVIYDMETRLPVSDVQVFVNPKGLVTSDYRGRFFVKDKCSSITLSHIAYEKRVLKTTEVKDTIWLLPKMNYIDGVVVTAMGPKITLDIKKVVRSETRTSQAPSGLDFFSIFKRHRGKSAEEQEKFKKILDKY